MLLAARMSCQDSRLPSWVPNWETRQSARDYRLTIQEREIRDYRRNDHKIYRASNGSLLDESPKTKIGELHLRGLSLGLISRVLVCDDLDLPVLQSYVEALRVFRTWCCAVDASSLYFTRYESQDAFRSTICASSNKDESMPKVVFQLLYDLMLYPDCQLFDPAQAKEAYEAYENFLALENGDGWESWDEEFEEIATLFHIYLVDNQSPDPGHLFDLPSELSVYSVLRSITWTTGAISMRFRDLQNHSLLILDNCCGSSAYTAQEGDEVFLLKGLNVPVVLRPNGENYSFVGPCSYIHGVMEGQKWPEDESELQDLVLV